MFRSSAICQDNFLADKHPTTKQMKVENFLNNNVQDTKTDDQEKFQNSFRFLRKIYDQFTKEKS